MRTVAALCRRNLHAYYRDPAMVFLSMLSSAMVWVLYVLFLGHLQVTRLQEDIPYATETQITAFVDSWVFSGILMITAFMTGFTALNIYVDDLVTKRFKEFRAMPIRAAHVVLGYQITSIIVAMIMSMVVLIVGYLIIGFADSTWLKPMALLEVFGITLLMSIAFTAFSLFLGSWAPSHAAANAVGIIIGTILGFFAGTYLPMGALTDSVANGINMLPFSQAAMLLRDPLAGDTLNNLSGGVPAVQDNLSVFYGFHLQIHSVTVQKWWVVAYLVGMTVVFTILGAIRIGRSIK